MQIDEIKRNLASGIWVSVAPEIRPSTIKTPAGDIKPLYCSRRFVYSEGDRFQLTFLNYADPFGKVPLVEMLISGHVQFGPAHPIAPGAYEANYIADSGFSITVMNAAFATAINSIPLGASVQPWAVNVPQDVLGKSVPTFGLKAGEFFTEYDLVYIKDDLLFNGSRNVDGRPFDRPENRPTNLQAPLLHS